MHGATAFALHTLCCICCHFFAFYLLARDATTHGERTTQRGRHTQPDDTHSGPPDLEHTIAVRSVGMLAAAYTLSLQAILPGSNPLATSVARVLCFHYACKLLDLTVARARRPPLRLVDARPTDLSRGRDRLAYAWLLFTEYRYFSFDIAVVHQDRKQSASRIWTYAPPVLITLAVLLLPTLATKSLFGLMAISTSLELIHTIAHPRCQQPLFWQPFAATSVSAFWRVHWHQGASPWLYSLGYVPMKRLFTPLLGIQAGRAAGILGTFSLSGLWHGWAAMPAITDPWRMAAGMWLLFLGQGVICLLEQSIPKRYYGSLLHSAIVWSVSLWALAAWVGNVKEVSKIPEWTKYI